MRRSLLPACLAVLALAVPAGAAKTATVHNTQSSSYLMIDPIYTTIMDGNRIAGLMMVGIGLDVPDGDLRAQAKRSMPVLRDVYVRSLMAYTATSVRPWRQPDVGEIADRLQRVTDRTLKRKGARILLAQVAMRLKK
ncbi:MAG TPA: hypothetical protein VGC27_03645 [Rhizomicrobium sp.]